MEFSFDGIAIRSGARLVCLRKCVAFCSLADGVTNCLVRLNGFSQTLNKGSRFS